jgi:IS5 family transposase
MKKTSSKVKSRARQTAAPRKATSPEQKIIAAARAGVRHALKVHKRLGQSIVVWEDGKVRRIPARQIKA